MGTAYITLMILMIFYLVSFDPASAGKPNPIDLGFLVALRRVLKKIYRKLSRKEWATPDNVRFQEWQNALSQVRYTKITPTALPAGEMTDAKRVNKCVLTLSDLQILTGIGILVSAYVQLPCGISIYHWQIVVYLAWFSSLTHLTTLTFLRHYLQERPAMRTWRLLAMSLMLVLLLLALLPTGRSEWLEYYYYNTAGAYAICIFKSKEGLHYHSGMLNLLKPAFSASSIISITTLSISYVTKVVRMHTTTAHWVFRRTRILLGKHYKSMLKFMYDEAHHSTVERNRRKMSSLKICLYWIKISILSIGYRLALAVFLTIRVVLDLCDSMLWEVSEHGDLPLLSLLTRVLHR